VDLISRIVFAAMDACFRALDAALVGMLWWYRCGYSSHMNAGRVGPLLAIPYHVCGSSLNSAGFGDSSAWPRSPGASNVTLYKWWPCKEALALEAYFHAVEQTLAFPDTGDIEADLTAQVRSFIALLAGRASRAVGFHRLRDNADLLPRTAPTLIFRW
jgi:hypothetical protein